MAKKIVIDARELRGTGVGRYIDRLLHFLQEVDTDSSHQYIILLKPMDMESWQPDNKRFTKVACRFKEFTVAEQTGLLWQILELQPDLVHFPIVQQPIFYHGKVVTTMQDLTTLRFTNPSKNPLVFKFKQWVYRWVNVIAARKSAALITPSEFVKDDVARTLKTNSRKITVTYEAGDSIDDAPEVVEAFEGKQFIMYVGRPLPHKNLSRLIEAFAVLKQTNTELELVLAGKKDVLYRRHERETRRLGIPDVHFTGFISDGQLRWLYEHCAAYVFPSLSEGFGLPGLEAMAHGAPVVSSDVACLPEIYGDAAYYFDPNDTEAMAKAIGDVLDRPDLRSRLIAAGKVQVKTYSWRRMAEQTLDVYRQLLDEK
jgi:glycosyltransferase involved in cell wall biosynthesis